MLGRLRGEDHKKIHSQVERSFGGQPPFVSFLYNVQRTTPQVTVIVSRRPKNVKGVLRTGCRTTSTFFTLFGTGTVHQIQK